MVLIPRISHRKAGTFDLPPTIERAGNLHSMKVARLAMIPTDIYDSVSAASDIDLLPLDRGAKWGCPNMRRWPTKSADRFKRKIA